MRSAAVSAAVSATALAAVVLLAAGVLSACGEEDPAPPGKARPTPREQYVNRADAICARLGTETRVLAETTFDDPGQPSDGVKRFEQLARGYGLRECGGR